MIALDQLTPLAWFVIGAIVAVLAVLAGVLLVNLAHLLAHRRNDDIKPGGANILMGIRESADSDDPPRW